MKTTKAITDPLLYCDILDGIIFLNNQDIINLVAMNSMIRYMEVSLLTFVAYNYRVAIEER